MGQIAKALGEGPTFSYKDKTYTLSPWTYKVQARYEQYLEAKAYERADRLAAGLPPGKGKSVVDKALEDIGAGVYTFGSEVCGKSLSQFENQKALFLFSLQQKHPEAGMELVEEMFADEQFVNELLSKMSEANADPNSRGGSPVSPAAPTPEGQGPPSTT